MKFYGYVGAIAYQFSKRVYDRLYGSQAGRRAIIFSGIYTAVCQVFLALGILALVELITGISPFQSQLFSLLILLVTVGWVIRGGISYNNNRLQEFVDEIINKTVGQKIMLGMLTIAALLLPLLVIALVWA